MPVNQNTRHTCGSHHSMLHFTKSTVGDKSISQPILENAKQKESQDNAVNSFCSTTPSCSYTVLLSTAIIRILLPNGKTPCIRVLVDNASQSNFLTKSCCKRLKLPTSQYASLVSGMGVYPQKITGQVHLKVITKFESTLTK